MATTLIGAAAEGTPNDDGTLSLLIAVFVPMSGPERCELLAFLDFWRDLPREDRALFARSVKPSLTDDQVARLSGVSRRTLYRWSRYQDFKRRLDDYRPDRKKWRLPDDDEAA